MIFSTTMSCTGVGASGHECAGASMQLVALCPDSVLSLDSTS